MVKVTVNYLTFNKKNLKRHLLLVLTVRWLVGKLYGMSTITALF